MFDYGFMKIQFHVFGRLIDFRQDMEFGFFSTVRVLGLLKLVYVV